MGAGRVEYRTGGTRGTGGWWRGVKNRVRVGLKRVGNGVDGRMGMECLHCNKDGGACGWYG